MVASGLVIYIYVVYILCLFQLIHLMTSEGGVGNESK